MSDKNFEVKGSPEEILSPVRLLVKSESSEKKSKKKVQLESNELDTLPITYSNEEEGIKLKSIKAGEKSCGNHLHSPCAPDNGVPIQIIQNDKQNGVGNEDVDKIWEAPSPKGTPKLPHHARGMTGLEYQVGLEKKKAGAAKRANSLENGIDGDELRPVFGDFIPKGTTELDTLQDPGFGYVHAQLDLMFVTGMSPYDRNEKARKDQMWCETALRVVQKIIFWYVSIMATWQSFNFIKYFILSLIENRTLDDLIYVGFFLLTGVMQVTVVYFLAFQQNKITNMLTGFDQFDSVTNNEAKYSKTTTYLIVVIYGTFSILTSISKTLLEQGVFDWSYDTLILENSGKMAEGLFIWTPGNFQNMSRLHETYKANLTTTTYMMGSCGIMAGICWNLQIDCFRDLIIFATTVNKDQLVLLGKELLNCLLFKKTNASDLATVTKDLRGWKIYRKAINVNDVTNDCFSILWKLYNINAFMSFSIFWVLVLDKLTDGIILIFYLYNLGKILYTYSVARKSSTQNEVCRAWIRTLPCGTKLFRVGRAYFKRYVMLDELRENPMGFGKGKFHIDDEFLFIFIGLVGSLLGVLMSEN